MHKNLKYWPDAASKKKKSDYNSVHLRQIQDMIRYKTVVLDYISIANQHHLETLLTLKHFPEFPGLPFFA